MDATITLGQLMQVVTILGGLWGGYKLIKEIIVAVNNKHDQVQKWDEYDQQIKDIKEEQCLITYCIMAMLDGLTQLGADGQVNEAKEMLNKHINKQAHGQTK